MQGAGPPLRGSADDPHRRRTLGGIGLSLAAAAAYGVFAPAAKGAATGLGPLRAAGLSYVLAGLMALAAIGLRSVAGMARGFRPLARSDAPRLLGMTILGGVIGPAVFFTGIVRVQAHQAAMLQHLEFVLTILAAVLFLGERPGRRGWIGLGMIGAGLIVLSIPWARAEAEVPAAWTGALCLVAACAAWAADNTLAREASDLDPLLVVSVKGLGAGAALLAGAPHRSAAGAAGDWGWALLAGGIGVGLSLVLELLALRRIGAALNAGFFSTGPAFAFLWSLLFLHESAGLSGWAALLLCASGAVALATDRHEHLHVHPAEGRTGRIEHSHPHVHDTWHRHLH